MNSIEVRTEQVAPGAFVGQFRTIRSSEWKTVQENGVRRLFDTPELAELAAYRALREFWQCDVIGFDVKKTAIEAANAIFRPGKKPIPVVKRGRR